MTDFELTEANSLHGTTLSKLGLRSDYLTLRGLGVAGGAVKPADGPEPYARAAVLLVPLDDDGKQLKPMAVMGSVESLMALRDKFSEVIDASVAAGRELFEHGTIGGKAPGENEED